MTTNKSLERLLELEILRDWEEHNFPLHPQWTKKLSREYQSLKQQIEQALDKAKESENWKCLYEDYMKMYDEIKTDLIEAYRHIIALHDECNITATNPIFLQKCRDKLKIFFEEKRIASG